MSNLETSTFELDPSYDPERLEGSKEKIAETASSAPYALSVARVQLDGYSFDSSTNPFAWDEKNQQSLDGIASDIDTYLQSLFSMENTLVRGVQSGNHDIDRDELINQIMKDGSDSYGNNDAHEIYAATYTDTAVNTILSGFHVFKPKCEERPQHRVDIWLVFDNDAFNNIEYIHSRHNTVAKDKWQLKYPAHNGLKGILVIS